MNDLRNELVSAVKELNSLLYTITEEDFERLKPELIAGFYQIQELLFSVSEYGQSTQEPISLVEIDTLDGWKVMLENILRQE